MPQRITQHAVIYLFTQKSSLHHLSIPLCLCVRFPCSTVTVYYPCDPLCVCGGGGLLKFVREKKRKMIEDESRGREGARGRDKERGRQHRLIFFIPSSAIFPHHLNFAIFPCSSISKSFVQLFLSLTFQLPAKFYNKGADDISCLFPK